VGCSELFLRPAYACGWRIVISPATGLLTCRSLTLSREETFSVRLRQSRQAYAIDIALRIYSPERIG
jgi:hypothetical protein